MKIGIFTEEFTREYVSSSMLHTVNHYKGQMLISEGDNSKCLDDFTVDVIKHNPKVLDLTKDHFEQEKELHESTRKEILALGGEYTPDNITWFVNQERYPIKWFESIEEAFKHYQVAPKTRDIATSSPVSVQ